MAEVVNDTEQDFWRPAVVREGNGEVGISVVEIAPALAEACSACGTEFMIGARFCHTCGALRVEKGAVPATKSRLPWREAREVLVERAAWLRSATAGVLIQTRRIPAVLRYLHFHEIKRWVGLPTASLIAFFIGLGCVGGAVVVTLVYTAKNFVDWQAIQFYRAEWLLAATASFVAGILLKKPADR
jgi:hypothetical protein